MDSLTHFLMGPHTTLKLSTQERTVAFLFGILLISFVDIFPLNLRHLFEWLISFVHTLIDTVTANTSITNYVLFPLFKHDTEDRLTVNAGDIKCPDRSCPKHFERLNRMFD